MKNFFFIILSLVFFGSVLTQYACGKDDECTTENMSFANDIKPILTDNGCLASGCHNSAAAFPYDTYAKFKVVVDSNRVLGAIKREANFSPMPKVGDKMSDCDISKVEAWITQGAKDN